LALLFARGSEAHLLDGPKDLTIKPWPVPGQAIGVGFGSSALPLGRHIWLNHASESDSQPRPKCGSSPLFFSTWPRNQPWR